VQAHLGPARQVDRGGIGAGHSLVDPLVQDLDPVDPEPYAVIAASLKGVGATARGRNVTVPDGAEGVRNDTRDKIEGD
jgi:hypothetical protein